MTPARQYMEIAPFFFTSHSSSYHDSVLPMTRNAYVQQTFLALNSDPLRMFDDLAQNFLELVLKPSYREALFESDGPVDEDVLRQFENEVKDKVKIARLMIVESKKLYVYQLKIQKV
ncbi:putative galacturonosyltransferase 9 [Camellia lanceoleosa]|uniref:Galacturonosyltransferase 9 n=1 Tax=Camellia lanceoleosa TaxID=1840588 RepID=A0ACC0IWX5_9ERIC|nr:putative galacturonosyltransferase 9 [Camellia lanceoleosa]